jgi:hypothetical protein
VRLEGYDPSLQLLQEARESWDYCESHKLVNCLQSGKINSDSFVGIAKQYIEGDFWIECHVTFEGKGNPYHACIVVESDQTNYVLRNIRESEIRDRGTNGYSPMLVDVAKKIELPQAITLECSVPSLVRLKQFNLSDCICGDSNSVVHEFVRLRGRENRKLRSLRVSSGVVERESPNQLIERRAEAVQEITDDESNLVGRVFQLNPNDVDSIFNIVLSKDSAWFRFCEAAQPVPQVFKMFVRPSSFQIGISQRNGHTASISG